MGIKIARGVKDINHAQFADDTLLLGWASTIIARKFKQQLDLYKEASGSQINHRKSQIFGWNCKPREMVEISRILEMEGETQWESVKYLGVPIFKSKPKYSHWSPVIDKIKTIIQAWGASWLNLAGKLVFLKSVLASIPIYQSSILLAPSGCIRQIESLLRRFLWK
jgi:hypothetical protein